MNIANWNFRAALTLLIVFGIGGCATSLRSSVDVADHADFGALNTYAWITDQPLFVSAAASAEVVNPLNEQRIRTAVEERLQNKGYRKANIEQADFVVAFTLGARDRVRVRQYYNDFGYGYYGYHHGFSRFGRGYNGFGSGVSVQQFNEGTLAVDIFENTQKEAIWHGSASKRLSRNSGPQELIDEAVKTLLAEFPDRKVMGAMTKAVTS